MHKVLFKPLVDGVAHLTSTAAAWADWREKQTDLPYRDIWAALLEARDPKTGEPFTREELVSEATTLITAGTDTVITASCATMFYLVHNPAALERLTREIRDAYPNPEKVGSECPIQFASKELQDITFLLACIDEAMRLSPPVLSTLPRTAGEGGIVVDGEFFPEGITLGIPHYVLQRDPKTFPEPHSFIPERWTSEQPTQASEKGPMASIARRSEHLKAGDGLARGYTPFGVGRGSCIGKHLAYQEMSYIIARLLWQFDVRVAPEEKARDVDKSGLSWRKGEFRSRDRFVSSQEGPILQLRTRT
jgi:cytochrome P450